MLDASLIGPLAIPDEQPRLSDEAIAILGNTMLVVPQHWHLEVANLLSVAFRRGRVTTAQRDEALILLTALPITVDDQTISSAWSSTIALADRHRLTCYDAAYLELALRLDASLATRDRALIAVAKVENTRTLDFQH